jgi:hypothetical protein
MSDLELDPEQFREVPIKPLANPRVLRRGLVWWAAYTALAGFAGWRIGTWWSAYFAAIPAIWFGAGLAGLWPRFFFSSRDKDN